MAKKVKKSVDGQKKPEVTINPSRDVPVTYETVTQPAILDEIREYAVSGLTMQQIAHRLLVNTSTLYNWTKKYPELKDVILEGQGVADDRVELSLYEMCFPHDEREITIEKDASGQVVKQTIRTKHVPANVTAIQYWLQNRRRTDWKSHQSLEVASSTSAPLRIIYDLDTKEKPDIEDMV